MKAWITKPILQIEIVEHNRPETYPAIPELAGKRFTVAKLSYKDKIYNPLHFEEARTAELEEMISEIAGMFELYMEE